VVRGVVKVDLAVAAVGLASTEGVNAQLLDERRRERALLHALLYPLERRAHIALLDATQRKAIE
jgi:hypothetical protein